MFFNCSDDKPERATMLHLMCIACPVSATRNTCLGHSDTHFCASMSVKTLKTMQILHSTPLTHPVTVNLCIFNLYQYDIILYTLHVDVQQNVDYPNVNHPKHQISEPTFSSFNVQTTKNQRLLHAVNYCVNSIKYCILYVLYCTVMVTLSQRNLQILCTVWLLGSVIRTVDYPNYRWSQLVRIIDVLL